MGEGYSCTMLTILQLFCYRGKLINSYLFLIIIFIQLPINLYCESMLCAKEGKSHFSKISSLPKCKPSFCHLDTSCSALTYCALSSYMSNYCTHHQCPECINLEL